MSDQSSGVPAARPALALLAYVGVSIAWGTTYGAIKVAVADFPPFTMAAIRFLVAGILMIGVFRAFGILLPGREDYRRLAVVGFFLLSVSNGLLSFAEQYVDSAFAALMVNIAPFAFVGLTAMVGQHVPRMAWVGLLVGFAGVVVLVSPELRDVLMSDTPPDATFWMAVVALMVGPLCWAMGSFFSHRRPPRCHPLMGASWQTLFGGIGALAISSVNGEWSRTITPTASSVWAIVYLVFIGSFLGYVCYNYCVIRLPAARTASTTYLNMVVALLVGALLLGETLTLEMLIGGGVILCGVVIVNTARLKGPAKDKRALEGVEEPVSEGS